MYPRIRFEDLPPLDPVKLAHYRAGPECQRGGCHRLGVDYFRLRWPSRYVVRILCQPCADAIERAR